MRLFKKLFLAVFVLAIATLIVQLSQNDIHARSSGSPGGYSGSIGDGQTCRTCHSGPNASSIENAITSDIPASGYIPGEIYNISATIQESNRNRFGFELTAETDNNVKIGEWILTAPDQTRLTNSNKVVTHTSSGRVGSGTKTWEMQWKAPEVSAGAITFYAALMAADGANGNSGDNVYVSQKKVDPVSTSVKKREKRNLNLSVYPNPATNRINLDFPEGMNETYGVYIIDAGGVVRAFYEKRESNGGKLALSVGDLASGQYYVRVFSENYTAVTPFLKR
ncbi:choice-of-anchor V domain-containing protein [Luteibaculum oceani]|uniref:T9SS type A sorting domain-containing protein n=1 Tax=Luteibaculum oceani TaxID=1294296 RepID=A0A5C6VIY7_9FLAO|nr:choice-of-anchor V domain-containing protein [Luteibaculum oceani]TXC85127.1 T9SS type A sorting domain-containing protein [Luteibaculum oceani]